MEKAQCNKCGDCCETIWVSWKKKDLDYSVALRPPTKEYKLDDRQYDAWFIKTYWNDVEERNGFTRFECEWWNRETRLCMAQDKKPPVCKNFPWYGREPKASTLQSLPRCSFWQDVLLKKR